MANLSKERRDRMIAKLEELKQEHNDDASIAALNEIENALREKKYGLVWEEHSEAVDEMLKENIPVLVADDERRLCRDPEMPWNFIIEGDNLQALYLLEKTHRGKVDCIYIDPPYNSGATDWKYNNNYVAKDDEYRHSKWLSMMKVRLVLAKRLLNPKDSVLIITIDEKEYLHLGCLIEELYPEARIQMVSSVINPAGAVRQGEFARTNEYIFFVMNGNSCPDKFYDEDTTTAYSESLHWNTLRRTDLASARGTTKGGIAQFYPIYVNNSTHRIECVGDPLTPEIDRNSVEDIAGCTTVFPVRDDGTEMNWGLVGPMLMDRAKKGYVSVGKYDPSKPQQYSISYLRSGRIKDIETGKFKITGYADNGSIQGEYVEKRGITPTTQWNRKQHDAYRNGTTLISTILCNARFTFPKSLYAVKDCLHLFVINKPNALIVDFFAGSGTTQHAVSLLNAEDGGKRRCIMVTNNEIGESDEKRFAVENYGNEKLVKWDKPPTAKNARFQIDYDTEEFLKFKDFYGIAKYVTWPRTVCSIEGHDIEGNPLDGNYLGSNIPMADGFNANVKYFKCDWTPRKPEDYLLSNALCLHIKELIELCTAEEVDGEITALILSKEDYHRIFDDPDAAEKVQHLWVNENVIFSAEEMRKMRKKWFRYIPREFFSQELKEAGEYV